jgi:1,4-dihydroxy-2-naphthoate octaprenyltransferase
MATATTGTPTTAAVWWQATRAYSFPASIVPVLLGTALAWRGYGASERNFDALVFALTLVGALLAHAAGNVWNDYFDYRRGVDTRPEHGSGVLTGGLLTPSRMRAFGTVLLAGAAVCGLLIVARRPAVVSLVVPLALLGAACALLYTPTLKRFALGDLVIMIAFGLGLTLGAYGVQTPIVSAAQVGRVLLLSLPLTLLVDAILHANNIRDAADDGASGVLTLARALGTRNSAALQAVLVFGPVALVAVFVLLRLIPPSALAVLLTVPLLVKGFRTGDVPFLAQAHLLFGLLYALGIVVLPRF